MQVTCCQFVKSRRSHNKDFVRDERLIELRNYMKDCFFEIYEMHKNKEDVVEAINRYIKAIL